MAKAKAKGKAKGKTAAAAEAVLPRVIAHDEALCGIDALGGQAQQEVAAEQKEEARSPGLPPLPAVALAVSGLPPPLLAVVAPMQALGRCRPPVLLLLLLLLISQLLLLYYHYHYKQNTSKTNQHQGKPQDQQTQGKHRQHHKPS